MNMNALVFQPEVRDMCAAGRCRRYGRSWSCPPACGELDDLRRQFARYSRGILVQTGDGVLLVTELQWQAKKAMDYKSFMNGARNFIGSVLE